MAIKTVVLTINGVNYTVPLTSGNTYSKAVTAPTVTSYNQPEHIYAMILKVEDMAGNVTTVDKNHSTYGARMKLRVKEKVAPAITVTSPSSGAYLTNSSVLVSVDVTDTGSGVNADTINVKIDNAAVSVTKTAIANGYRCSYTSTLADAAHTITVNAADYDGNAASQKTISFTVDTVPPTLNVSTPVAGLITNAQGCAVTGATNDATSGLASVKITLNGADQGNITVAANGTFSKSVTLTKGTNTIVVTATDRAGKTSTVSRTVLYDPDAPQILAVTVTPNPVDAGATFTITVQAQD